MLYEEIKEKNDDQPFPFTMTHIFVMLSELQLVVMRKS